MITKKQNAVLTYSDTNITTGSFKQFCVGYNNRVFATHSTVGDGVWYSDDYVTWTHVDVTNVLQSWEGSNVVTSICYLPSIHRLCVCYSSQCYIYTEDNGETWTRSIYQSNVSIKKIIQLNGTTRFFAMDGSFFGYSDDLSKPNPWTKINVSSILVSSYNFLDNFFVSPDDKVYLGIANSGGGYFRVDIDNTNEVTFTKILDEPSMGDANKILFCPNGHVWAYIRGQYYFSPNGVTGSWVRVNSFNSKLLLFNDGNNILHSYTNQLIIYNSNTDNVTINTVGTVLHTYDANIIAGCIVQKSVYSKTYILALSNYGIVCVKISYDNEYTGSSKLVTKKEIQELIAQCKAYVQSKKQS